MTETSKATARPWRVYGWTVDGADDRPVARAAADYCADTLTTPESAREWSIWNAESKRTDEAASANAALIVERVNGWEALVAERDALREALEHCQRTLAAIRHDSAQNDSATCLDWPFDSEAAAAIDTARAALAKGAGA